MEIQYFFPLKNRLEPIKEKNNRNLICFNENSIFLPIENSIETY